MSLKIKISHLFLILIAIAPLQLSAMMERGGEEAKVDPVEEQAWDTANNSQEARITAAKNQRSYGTQTVIDSSTDEVEALTKKIEKAQQALSQEEEGFKGLRDQFNAGNTFSGIQPEIARIQRNADKIKGYLKRIVRKRDTLTSSLSENNLDPSATISETEQVSEIDTPNRGVDASEQVAEEITMPQALRKFYDACHNYPEADRLILDPTLNETKSEDSVRPWEPADGEDKDEKTIKDLQEELANYFQLSLQTTINIINKEIPRSYSTNIPGIRRQEPRKLSSKALDRILQQAAKATLAQANPEDPSTRNTRIANPSFTRETEGGTLIATLAQGLTRIFPLSRSTRTQIAIATAANIGSGMISRMIAHHFRSNPATIPSSPEALSQIKTLLSGLINRERTIDAFNEHYEEPNRLYTEVDRAWSKVVKQWQEMKIYDPVKQRFEDMLTREKQRLSESKEETKTETLLRRTQQATDTLLTDVMDNPTIPGGSIQNPPDIHLAGIIGVGYELIKYQISQSRYSLRDSLEEILKRMTEEDQQRTEQAENDMLTAADLGLNARKKEKKALSQDATRTAKFVKAIKPPTTNTRDSWEEWLRNPALHEKMEEAEKTMLIKWVSNHAIYHHQDLSKSIFCSWKERMKKSKKLLEYLKTEAREELSELGKFAKNAELIADKKREEREVCQMWLEEILARESKFKQQLLSAQERLISSSTRSVTANYIENAESIKRQKNTIENTRLALQEITRQRPSATQASEEKEKEFSTLQAVASLLAKNYTILNSSHSRKIKRALVRARADLEAWDKLYLKEELDKLQQGILRLQQGILRLQKECNLRQSDSKISTSIEEIKRKTDTNYGSWREHDRWRVYLVMEDLKKEIWPTLSGVMKEFRENPSEGSLKRVRQVANKVGNAGAMIAASAIDVADIADVLEAVQATCSTTQTALDEYCKDTVQHSQSLSILRWIPDAAREIVDFVEKVHTSHSARTASARSPILVEERSPILVEERSPILVEERNPILVEERNPILVEERNPILVEENSKIKELLNKLPNNGLGAENRPAIIGIIQQVREKIWPHLRLKIQEFINDSTEKTIDEVRKIASACIPHYAFNSASTYASSYASVSAYAYPAASEYASSYASSWYYAYPPARDYAHAYAPLSAFASSYASIYSSAYCEHSKEAEDAGEAAEMVVKGARALHDKSKYNNWDGWYHPNIQDNLSWAVDVANLAVTFSKKVEEWKKEQENKMLFSESKENLTEER